MVGFGGRFGPGCGDGVGVDLSIVERRFGFGGDLTQGGMMECLGVGVDLSTGEKKVGFVLWFDQG